MAGAWNDRMLNGHALLSLELFDQAGNLSQGRDPVAISMHEESGGRTRREKGEIETAGRRRDRDETFDFRPPHQELHANPGAERDAGDPAGARLGPDARPLVEPRRRVR